MNAEIPILFDDGNLLVVNKPSGLLSVPGRKPELQDCVWGRLQDQFPDREVLLVHRLDRDTSGLMLFACSKEIQGNLGRQFEHRRIHKEYVACVHGKLPEASGVVDGPIRKDWTKNDPPTYFICHEKGKAAVTRYRVEGMEGDISRVRLFPETGRSHQLRVHMLSLGCPIVGDPIYSPGDGGPRLCLHAEKISFYHWISKEKMTFEVSADF
ncbi:RluA family pseudouridine synthase [Kiritimatiellota bacterium B12222]|nr:RluA family pseudouridine synthase [Kiritimatiellota bacterium B12222]